MYIQKYVSLGVVSAWCCLSSPIPFIFSAPFPYLFLHSTSTSACRVHGERQIGCPRRKHQRHSRADFRGSTRLTIEIAKKNHTKSHLTEETERKTSLCTEAELNRMDFGRALAKPWCLFVVRAILDATCGVNWNPSDFCKQLVCPANMCTPTWKAWYQNNFVKAKPVILLTNLKLKQVRVCFPARNSNESG